MGRTIYLPEEYDKIHAGWKHWLKKGMILAAALIMGLCLTGSVIRGKQTSDKMREMQKGLAEEVFRFHVLANSDSEEDQELKLKVRDAVISYMKEELPESRSLEETKKWAEKHLCEIEETSEAVVRAEGYAYPIRAGVEWTYFPEKAYGDVTFPAGRYEALRIEIGEAGGRNWWCALYPNLCFIDCVHAVVPDEGKQELQSVLTDEEYEMVTEQTRFKVKWFFLGDTLGE